MSLLPPGRPLAQALPDLPELLAAPARYLGQAPLAIGPRRFYHLVAAFGIPGLLLLGSCLVQGQMDGERILIGTALLLGAWFWLICTLLVRGHEIVFHPEGLEVAYRGLIVWTPWALFAGRTGLSADGTTVPINASLLGRVQLWRDGAMLANGLGAIAPQWRLLGVDRVRLPGVYEIDSRDLGQLILWLGEQLGGQAKGEESPPT